MRALPVPWPVEELERRYRAAKDAGAARRYRARWRGARGAAARAPAGAAGLGTRAARAGVRRGLAEGLDALAARKPGSGAKPKLGPGQQAQVLAWADAEPRLTLHALAARVEERWGVAISHTQLWHLLRRAGFRRVVPRKRHHRADAAAQEGAKKS